MTCRGASTSPEAYLRAAELLGVDPADCVVIEDSLIGLAAARASGATTIGVPHHHAIPAGRADVVWPTLAGRRPDDLRLPLGPPPAGPAAGQIAV